VAMGICTWLISSAAGRRTERSEGAPISTICCGACAARAFVASLAVCSHRLCMRNMLLKKRALRPVGDRIRAAW